MFRLSFLIPNIFSYPHLNNALHKKINEGLFREDLYYRIAVVPLYIKPLRQRLHEIPSLVKSHLAKNNKTLTGKALDLILSNQWKGNIRQLFACLDRACVLSKSSVICDNDIKNSLY